jgi:hypothetical protein
MWLVTLLAAILDQKSPRLTSLRLVTMHGQLLAPAYHPHDDERQGLRRMWLVTSLAAKRP